MAESGQVGVYFLFGQEDESSDQRVYIGQTGELRQRLASHNQTKEFWDRARRVDLAHALTDADARPLSRVVLPPGAGRRVATLMKTATLAPNRTHQRRWKQTVLRSLRPVTC